MSHSRIKFSIDPYYDFSASEKDPMPDNQSQSAVSEALYHYCKQNNRNPLFIKKLKSSQGLCAGYTFLTYFCSWLEKQPKKFDELGKIIPRDDLTWLNNIKRKLLTWDKKSSFPSNPDVERLLSYILHFGGYSESYHENETFYQNKTILHVAEDIEDTRGRKLEKENLGLTTIITGKDFSKTIILEEEKTSLLDILVQDNKMTYVVANQHASALWRERSADGEKIYYYYNSNDKKGIQTFPINKSGEHERLVKLLFAGHSSNFKNFETFTFTTFSIHSPENVLPDKKEISFHSLEKHLLPQLEFIALTQIEEKVDSIIRNIKNLTEAKKNKIKETCESKEYKEFVSVSKQKITKKIIKESQNSGLLTQIAKHENLFTLKFYFEHGAKLTTKILKSSLIFAIDHGDYEMCKYLLEKATQDKIKLGSLKSPLLLAMNGKHTRIAELLLKNNAKISPDLFLFAVINNDFETVSHLINAGADINEIDNISKQSAIHIAVINGSLKIFELLIAQKKLKFDEKDIHGTTPLSFASQCGDIDMVERLIKLGAKVDLADDLECTPLSYAAENGYADIIERLCNVGANVNHKDKVGRTPIFYAANNVNSEALNLLIKMGADVNAQNNKKFTPISTAARAGHVENIRILLEAGANPNLTEKTNAPPLLLTMRGKHFKAMELLGATPTLINALKDHEADFNEVDKLIINLAEIHSCYSGPDPLNIVESITNAFINCYRSFFASGNFTEAFNILLYGNSSESKTEKGHSSSTIEGILPLLNRLNDYNNHQKTLIFFRRKPLYKLQNLLENALEESHIIIKYQLPTSRRP